MDAEEEKFLEKCSQYPEEMQRIFGLSPEEAKARKWNPRLVFEDAMSAEMESMSQSLVFRNVLENAIRNGRGKKALEDAITAWMGDQPKKENK